MSQTTVRELDHPTTRPTDHPTLLPPTRAPSPTSAQRAIQTPAWFNDVVLYEIFPRSFYDTNADGIGDLKGITHQLDYLKALGVGALWLTPIFESPSYHGYDTTDYYKIQPEFGAEQDLIELVNAAHERDIKIILDFVAGHSSDRHPFFKDAYGNPKSKYAQWYRWLDDAHTQYEYFGTNPGMPKWNQDNPETAAYLIDIAQYWIDKANIDGYRLDYALGVSHGFWKNFRAKVKTFRRNVSTPDFLLLGEVWDSGLKIAPYYDEEFDATFDFPVYFDLMGSYERAGNSSLLGKRALASFQSSLKAETRLYPPGAQAVRFINNHDTVRVMSQVNAQCTMQNAQCTMDSMQRAKLAATLLMTLPGTPMMYYGEEIGMRGDKSDGDKTVREPMDWYASDTGAGMTHCYKPATRFNKPNDGVSVQEQDGKSDSLLELYRTLSALRAKSPALRTGEFIAAPITGNDKAAAYARVLGNEMYLIVANAADVTADLSLELRILNLD
ncbi:MAG: hypothetical protein HY741_17375, partial [Chloroflexi bacterium]|nr:hypothetical protein [Chloroflexota bacterium]